MKLENLFFASNQITKLDLLDDDVLFDLTQEYVMSSFNPRTEMQIEKLLFSKGVNKFLIGKFFNKVQFERFFS